MSIKITELEIQTLKINVIFEFVIGVMNEYSNLEDTILIFNSCKLERKTDHLLRS